MLDIVIWIIIIALFISSFISIIYPFLPGTLFLWVGFIIYHFLINQHVLSISFWVIVLILTIILIISDIITNRYFVKKFGGSKWGERAAAVAIIIGAFIWPPFGILIIPIVTVVIVEILQRRTVKEALYASLGSFIGFLSGTIAKVFIQLIMIVLFVVVILIKG